MKIGICDDGNNCDFAITQKKTEPKPRLVLLLPSNKIIPNLTYVKLSSNLSLDVQK